MKAKTCVCLFLVLVKSEELNPSLLMPGSLPSDAVRRACPSDAVSSRPAISIL